MQKQPNKCRKILISIKPEYADRIINGTKKYEFRSKKPRLSFDYIVIYWTFPKMKVLAEVKVEEILEYTPQQLGDKTKSEAGISEKDYFKYFMGREKAYAFRLGKIIKYSKPKNLKYFDCKFPPQSFIYLK